MGTITGIVLAANNQPISEATVLITEGPLHLDIAALTDEHGKFSLNDLQSGQYRMKVLAEGFIAVEEQISVRTRFTSQVNIVLEIENYVLEIN